MKRALVISGGGAKGAFAGGVAEYLINQKGNKYDLFIGTSTGSILLPLTALGEFKRLNEAFTTATQNDIFNVNPFILRKKGVLTELRMNHLTVIKQFIKKRITFGESYALRDRILKHFTYEDFLKLKEKVDLDIQIVVSNLSTNKVEYKSIRDCEYVDFVDWIWISCNYIPFMTLAKKDNCQYADGGLSDFAPINRAIEMGATEIDAIVLSTKQQAINYLPPKNTFELIFRSFDYVLNQVKLNDIQYSYSISMREEVKVNYFFVPHLLTTNLLVFEPEKMKKWWEMGFEYGDNKVNFENK